MHSFQILRKTYAWSKTHSGTLKSAGEEFAYPHIINGTMVNVSFISKGGQKAMLPFVEIGHNKFVDARDVQPIMDTLSVKGTATSNFTGVNMTGEKMKRIRNVAWVVLILAIIVHVSSKKDNIKVKAATTVFGTLSLIFLMAYYLRKYVNGEYSSPSNDNVKENSYIGNDKQCASEIDCMNNARQAFEKNIGAWPVADAPLPRFWVNARIKEYNKELQKCSKNFIKNQN